MRTYGLSKSRIVAGIQCHKRLYLQTYHRELAEESAALNYAFSVGRQVGDLARRLHTGSKLIDHVDDFKAALAETETLLQSGDNAVLFEAAFEHEGVLFRADILSKEPQGIRVVEVKAATGVKREHVEDCAIQAWVLRQAGYPLTRIELAHLDKTFVYQGDGNYDGLLKYVDLTDEVLPLQEQVARWVSEFKEVLAGPPPHVQVGDHCQRPYECPFLQYCQLEQPEYPVTDLPNARKVVSELLDAGIEDIRDIPADHLNDRLHERVRRATANNAAELDREAGDMLRGMPYPRYYLDFETLSFAVPIWPGTQPYQLLPFQWSCHVEYRNEDLRHAGFLDGSGEPPMRRLAEHLLAALGNSGPIFMYTHYEKNVIQGLASMFPDLARDLERLIDRLVDLYPLTRDHYYHPAMRGSWSLKAVLPTVARDLDYAALEEIQDGTAARRAYLEVIDPATSDERRKRLLSSLIEYCKLDTLALVRIARFLQQEDSQHSAFRSAVM